MPTAALSDNPEEVLTGLRFDPADPVSVQDASREMNAAIDAKLPLMHWTRGSRTWRKP